MDAPEKSTTATAASAAEPPGGDPPASEHRSQARKLLAKALSFQPIWVLLSLIGLVIAFSVLNPGKFFTEFNIVSLASSAAVLLVLSLGQTFVVVTAGIDLSVGSVLVFSGVISAEVMSRTGGVAGGIGCILLGLLASIAAGIGWGFVNGLLVAKARVPALITTLGTYGITIGLAQVITSGIDRNEVPTKLATSIGYGKLAGIPWIFVIALGLTVIAGLLLHTTRFGIRTYAIGSNAAAARRVAINVDRHLIKVYTLSGFCAGFAGFLSLARFSTTTIGSHATDNLSTITAVILGGASLFGGSALIVGTLIGVLIPVVLTNGLVISGIKPFWQTVVIGAVLILAVYIDQIRRSARER
jgi:ribose transport system permease protein